MGIELGAAALIISAASAGYQAYQGKAAATDAKHEANRQQDAANRLREEEDRNRLQTVMRMQKRRGAPAFGSTSSGSSGSKIGVTGEGQKTLLGL